MTEIDIIMAQQLIQNSLNASLIPQVACSTSKEYKKKSQNNYVLMAYGIPPPTPEEIIERENAIFSYLQALVNAEKINPDDDYEGERQLVLLKKIAICELPSYKRVELIALLTGRNIDDE